MLQYVIAGLALGSIYAIASAGLVVTFVSAGVLNFGADPICGQTLPVTVSPSS